MAVLRFIWQRVLAFDRVGSRIPQLVQIWLVEMFFALPLAFFIGKSIDIRGAFGVPHLRGRAVQTARLEVFAIVAKHSENAIRAAGPTTFGLARLRLLGTST